VFLTGQEEIENVVSSLRERSSQLSSSFSKLFVVGLYAGLTMEGQQKAFNPAPRNTRKVVISTNVAETSVTIDGIGSSSFGGNT